MKLSIQPKMAALQRALVVIESAPALADSQLCAAVLHNLVGAHLTAATPNVEAQTVTERLSLVGQAWFEAGQFDAASDCYLAAVRRLVANP